MTENKTICNFCGLEKLRDGETALRLELMAQTVGWLHRTCFEEMKARAGGYWKPFRNSY